MIEWGDDVNPHWSVDAFLEAVGAPDPDGSIQASRLIEDDLGLIPRPVWYERIEESEAQDRHQHWLVNRNVVLAGIAAVALWVALWFALKP